MKILITGNMGYVGPGVVKRLRESHPKAEIVGFDAGYFAHCLTNTRIFPEARADRQVFGDVRAIPAELLEGVDAVVYLAAISNDIMGQIDESLTMEINCDAAVKLAEQAKKAGVKNYVFASSCSVYGFAAEGAKTESSSLDPLTAYARSKVQAESKLKSLADGKFTVTCFRFATACGMSDRLRLDLVLNDFVAGAVVSKKISILSDGTPWRPLIHVQDMARAIDWGITRKAASGGEYLVVNTGSDSWNYQVKDLAAAVAAEIPGVEVSINKDAQPDKRSYRVDFSLYKKLAPDEYQPKVDLKKAVADLKAGLTGMKFNDPDYRKSSMIRLVVLTGLKSEGHLDARLLWSGNAGGNGHR